MRSDLKIEDGGFVVYEKSNLGKVNALRRAKSLPDVETPVIPTKGQALFTTAEEMHNEPASCDNCIFIRSDKHCTLIGPRISVQKITKDGIEYWPCCSMHTYGRSADGEYRSSGDPDYMGLIWINASKVGQAHGGANCGGCDGGDDCDHYIVDGATEKWESPTGFCRALQTTVACGDVCSLWGDDDELGWREAQKIING
jgi:hypothetical protein